jgi:hypothetical protein
MCGLTNPERELKITNAWRAGASPVYIGTWPLDDSGALDLDQIEMDTVLSILDEIDAAAYAREQSD